ncbi:hypothetical protein IWW39_000032 [Coemansia spiralis]|uniref:Uncharacterized protein n=1 Tax=Coemansia spiralis TaxID=417178 RepID=A0A9W8L7I9_9FUNG|nr:hypothetical protein IWW39_000032 [Coemansia spiralis]
MVSLFNLVTVAALVALCSVQVSGKRKPGKKPRPPRPAKADKCNPTFDTEAECLSNSRYRYCDDEWKEWVEMPMEPGMTCDADNNLVTNAAPGLASGPTALALGVAVAIWQFM